MTAHITIEPDDLVGEMTPATTEPTATDFVDRKRTVIGGVVGARFPRAWAEPQVLASPQSATPIQVFPTGCRFPRHSNDDEQGYLSVATRTASTRPLNPPVGARFRRQTRSGAL